jgi:hypothetical protein
LAGKPGLADLKVELNSAGHFLLFVLQFLAHHFLHPSIFSFRLARLQFPEKFATGKERKGKEI